MLFEMSKNLPNSRSELRLNLENCTTSNNEDNMSNELETSASTSDASNTVFTSVF